MQFEIKTTTTTIGLKEPIPNTGRNQNLKREVVDFQEKCN